MRSVEDAYPFGKACFGYGNADKYGFEIQDLKFKKDTFSSITDRVQEVIGVIEEHDRPEVFEEMGAEVIFGTPKFISKNEIEVELRDGEKRTMKSKRFCISTGSSPFVPPIEGIEETGYITNEEVFQHQRFARKINCSWRRCDRLRDGASVRTFRLGSNAHRNGRPHFDG